MSETVSERLIAELEGNATLIDRGGFTLDDQAARTKLAHHRLAEPSDWACIVVEAANLLGAARVQVLASIDKLSIRFDGEPLDGDAVFASAAEVQDPDGPSSRHLALRKLAIAISTLFGHFKVAVVEIESPRGRVWLHPHAPNERSPSAERHNLIRVLGLFTSERERERLRERCRYSPMIVEVEHERISFGLRQWLVEQGGRGITAIEVEGRTIGYAGLKPSEASPALYLMTHGVAAERLVTTGEGLAIVDVPLRKDIGESAVLRDAELDRVLELVEVTVGRIPADAEPEPLPTIPSVEPTPSADGLVVFVVVVFVLAVIAFRVALE